MQNTSPSKLEGPPLEPVTRKQLWFNASMATAPSVPASSRHQRFSKYGAIHLLHVRPPCGCRANGWPTASFDMFSRSGFTKRFILSGFTSAVVITLHKVLATTPRAVRMDWGGG
ncbi:hypothetical protein C8R42DRAFT_719815 [Lentinula raphanica]|nr:hypothetical protein C8R42DRAFT_719815 [Lentinula raphanica]